MCVIPDIDCAGQCVFQPGLADGENTSRQIAYIDRGGMFRPRYTGVIGGGCTASDHGNGNIPVTISLVNH